MKLIRVTFLDAQSAKNIETFHSESALVEYLFKSYDTHAPLTFEDEEGKPLDRQTMERIHERLFALRQGIKGGRVE